MKAIPTVLPPDVISTPRIWDGFPFSEVESLQGVHLDVLSVSESMLWVMQSGSAEHTWRGMPNAKGQTLQPTTTALKMKGHQTDDFRIAGGYSAYSMLFPEQRVSDLMREDAFDSLQSLKRGEPYRIGQDPFILQTMRTIGNEIKAGCPLGKVFAESISVALLTYIARGNGFFKAHEAAVIEPTRIRRVKEFIEDNITENISLTELAHLVCLSPRQLARLFKDTVGTSLHRYILERKVERSKALLRSLPPTSVAMTLGFSTHSHFTMTFRTVTGVTPSQYKKQVA